ncbi:MAG: hypothetical protein PVG53_10235, partial [Holophagae bacterium]
MIRPRPTPVGLALALALGTATVTCAGPDEIIDAIHDLRPDAAGAVHVENVRLDAGLAKVELSDGVLVPGTPVGGRPVELAFVGRGRIELEPPDRIEADQLELFTGSRRLDESFERAVFVMARDAAVGELLGGRPSDDGDAAAAVEMLRWWISAPERRRLDIEARIFADAVGDRLAGDTFCGVFDGDELGRFLYVVDPLAREQAALGRFVRPELTGRERRAVSRRLERAQLRGKLIGLEVEDLGVWDTWVSASLVGDDNDPTPGARGVEPEHYELDVRLSGSELALDGRAAIGLRTVVDGLRAVSFDLHPDLEPVRVTDGSGRELAWYRSRGELVAALRKPVAGGARLEIVIDYRGRPIETGPNGASVLRTTTDWYPHAGT